MSNVREPLLTEKKEDLATNRPKAVLFMNLAQLLMIVYIALMKEM